MGENLGAPSSSHISKRISRAGFEPRPIGELLPQFARTMRWICGILQRTWPLGSGSNPARTHHIGQVIQWARGISYHRSGVPVRRLLHRHALREVTRFIHITAKVDCEIIGKKLEGNHR